MDIHQGRESPTDHRPAACVRYHRLAGQQLAAGWCARHMGNRPIDGAAIHLGIFEAQPVTPLAAKPKTLPIGGNANKTQGHGRWLNAEYIHADRADRQRHCGAFSLCMPAYRAIIDARLTQR